MIKDSQRSKVYKAEKDVFTYYPGRVLAGFPGATMGEMKYGKTLTLKEAQELQDRIGANSFVANKWRAGKTTKVMAVVSNRKRRGSAAAYGGKIKYSPLALVDWIVLHEMAHEVNRNASRFGYTPNGIKYGRGDKIVERPSWDGGDHHYHASHGWRFCAIYLHLTRLYLGREAAAALKASFDRNKVRYKEPRAKRQLTDAQKQALTERLAKGREVARMNRIARSLP